MILIKEFVSLTTAAMKTATITAIIVTVAKRKRCFIG